MACNGVPGGFEDEYEDEFDCDGFILGDNDGVSQQTQLASTPANHHHVVSPPTKGVGRGLLSHIQTSPSTPGNENRHQFWKSMGNSGHTNGQPGSVGPKKNKYRPFTGHTNISVDEFRNAVMKGNLETVKHYLNDGIDVDTKTKTGWSGLMYAASCANTEMAKLLLENGADIHFHQDQYTVLMAACASTQMNTQAVTDCVALLLDNGADVNRFDRYHMTPLMYAAKEGRVDVVSMLIEFGADVDKQNNRGWTALVHATERNHYKVVGELLKANADPNLRCSDGQTAVDFACSNGQQKIADMLSQLTNDKKDDSILAAISSYQKEKPIEEESSNLQTYDKYGELETFLCGIQLHELIPVFRSHQVTFSAFLRMTDHDLQQLGIHKMGMRKLILDSIQSVHKKPWETSSLQSVQYNNFISCADAVAMVSNVSKHADYITSSIGYIKDQIKASPAILKRDQEGTGLKMLCKHTDQSLVHVHDLYHELTDLRDHLNEVKKDPSYTPSDLIVRKSKKTKRRWPVLAVGFGTLVCLGVWKRDLILERGTDLFTRITSR